MSPVGLANTRISTNYAQKSPRSLVCFVKHRKLFFAAGPVPGKFLGMVNQDPSDSKSNRF